MEILVPTLFHEIYRSALAWPMTWLRSPPGAGSLANTYATSMHPCTQEMICLACALHYVRDTDPNVFVDDRRIRLYTLSPVCQWPQQIIGSGPWDPTPGAQQVLQEERGRPGIMPHRSNSLGLTTSVHPWNFGTCSTGNGHHPARTPGMGCIWQCDEAGENATTFRIWDLWSNSKAPRGQGIQRTTHVLSSAYICLIWHGGNNNKVKTWRPRVPEDCKAWVILFDARCEKGVCGVIFHLQRQAGLCGGRLSIWRSGTSSRPKHSCSELDERKTAFLYGCAARLLAFTETLDRWQWRV